MKAASSSLYHRTFDRLLTIVIIGLVIDLDILMAIFKKVTNYTFPCKVNLFEYSLRLLLSQVQTYNEHTLKTISTLNTKLKLTILRLPALAS